MITARIDVTKIDKSRLFKGEKGTYLDIVLIETPNAKYGNDWMVKQSISKDDRDAGVDAPILGNGKTMNKKPAEPPASNQDFTDKEDDTPTDTDGLPF
jgi:hypothetical protein